MDQTELLNWKEKLVFSPEGPSPRVLLENSELKVIIAGLEAGQQIPEHPEAKAVYTFLEGAGWMTVNGERFPVEPGVVIVTPDMASRGVEAASRMIFLATRIAG